MSGVAIKLENVTKIYKLYKSPGDRLKEALSPFRNIYHEDFYAARNINLEVKQGEILGIVGKNGSGKSTLLKVVSGILTPNMGTVTVRGKISALLELGSGFNPEFTGLQNIYFYCAILGFTRVEVDEKLDSILAFAEIGDFIHQQVKTYSSGMKSRLGFAVAVNVNPEILILDEVLAVGDEYFRRKCYLKMQEFFNAGKTILFVSHSLQTVNEFCTRCILVDAGEIIMQGQTDEVIKLYRKLLFDNKEVGEIKKEITSITSKHGSNTTSAYLTNDNFLVINKDKSSLENSFDEDLITKTAQSFGPCNIEYQDISIIDENGTHVNNLVCGKSYRICYRVVLNQDVKAESLNFGVGIGAENNVFISGAHSNNIIMEDGIFNKGCKFDCELKFDCLLITGTYYLTCSTLSVFGKKRIMLRKLVDGYMFKVVSDDENITGIVHLLSHHTSKINIYR